MGKFVYSKNNGGKLFLGKALSLSVLNQLVSSGTNFLFGFYLVRVLSPVDFGLYGIGFAISLFYAGIGNALFLTQMVVHSPDKSPDDRSHYAARIFVAVILFAIVTLCIVGLLFLATAGELTEYEDLLFAISAISIAYLIKEFFVRHAYISSREIWALLIHVTLVGALGLIVLLAYIIHLQITVELAIYTYAGAHLAAIAVGGYVARLPVRTVSWKRMREDLRECWFGGRWAFITNLVYFLRIQAHTIAVTVSVGPVGVAYLNAARLLVTPATMLTPALGQVFMPRLAEIRAKHPENVGSASLLLSGFLLGVSLFYSIVLMLSFDFVVPLIVGERYAGSIYWLVVGWCLVSCLLALRNGLEMTAQVLKKFNMLMVANSVSAAIALLCVFGFVHVLGLIGSLIGLAIGEFVLVTILWLILNPGFKKTENHFRDFQSFNCSIISFIKFCFKSD